MTRTALSSVAAILLASSSHTFALNTENDWIGSGTGNVTTTTNWSLGHVPTVTEDAVFNASSTAGIKNYGTGATVGSPVTVGSLDVTATTGTYSIRNSTTGATNAVLNLGGAGNLGNGVSGTAGDLLFAASGSTLQLLGPNGSSGSGVLNVVLGQSGNFDAVGTIIVSSVISESGGAFAVTKSGAGALTLSGANSYSGGTTLSAGTLNINNNSALGTGTFTVNAGTVTNTSGGAVTTTNAQTWAGNFTIASGSGTSALNLNGPVTLTTNVQVAVSGTTSTPTIGGAIGGNFSLTKAGPGVGTLILGVANSYSGGTNVAAGTLVANADGTLGTGNVSLTAGNVTLTLQNGATNNYIADSANLNIGFTTDVVNLSYSGTDTIGSLTVNGVQEAPGVYGSSTSGAANVLPEFTGTGTLTVLSAIPEPSTIALLSVGLLLGASALRRKTS